MKVIMNTEQLRTIEDLDKLLKGVHRVVFTVLENKSQKYAWIRSTLIKFSYTLLSKREKGIVKKYIEKITGHSTAQITRLIQQYKKTGKIVYQHSVTKGFEKKYLGEDVLALVEMDELHGTLNGIATKKLCERAWQIYGDKKYKRLANISVSHLYNLRASSKYRNQVVTLTKTKPVKSNIGERRKPNPEGRPGYLRIDTVHQGDKDKEKGVYHINAIDEITQKWFARLKK